MADTLQLEPVAGVRMWIDQGASVHLLAVEQPGDPVELAEHEVEKVIESLQELLKQLRTPPAR